MKKHVIRLRTTVNSPNCLDWEINEQVTSWNLCDMSCPSQGEQEVRAVMLSEEMIRSLKDD